MNVIEFFKKADFKWAIQLNRFSLQIIGLWPQIDTTGSQKKLSSDLRLIVVFIIITCVCTIPLLNTLLKIWGDMTAVIDNLLFTLPLLMVSIKMLIMWWKKENLSLLIRMIAYDWTKPKSSDEREVMIRHAKNARLITACSYIIMISSVAVLIVISAFGYTFSNVINITDTGRPLPLQAYQLYDTSMSPQFEITFFIQCVALIMVSFSFTGIDNFLGFLIFHICGQIENLTDRLYRMRESKDFTAALKMNVQNHIRLIRFVAIVEDSFTIMLLIIFLYFCIVSSIYGYLFITIILEEKNVSLKRATFLIMVISTAIMHMCIYCAAGELLVIKYEQIYNAVNECKWYMLKTKEAKNLIFLMIRTNKPLYITAGKLLPMTMSTFCSILKTSGGYISVLLANKN